MKSFLGLFAATVFSFSVYAADPTTIDFSKINLEGLKVLDANHVDTFAYKLKLSPTPAATLVAKLEGESNSKMVSPLFELNEKSNFKNIYVYIGRTEKGTIEYVEALINPSSSIFIIDMDVVNVEKDHLNLVQGPSDDPEKYTAVSTRGNLFP